MSLAGPRGCATQRRRTEQLKNARPGMTKNSRSLAGRLGPSLDLGLLETPIQHLEPCSTICPEPSFPRGSGGRPSRRLSPPDRADPPWAAVHRAAPVPVLRRLPRASGDPPPPVELGLQRVQPRSARAYSRAPESTIVPGSAPCLQDERFWRSDQRPGFHRPIGSRAPLTDLEGETPTSWPQLGAHRSCYGLPARDFTAPRACSKSQHALEHR
jgi:hypothetical protein